MRIYSIFATLLLWLAAQSSQRVPGPFSSVTVNFPKNGLVLIQGIVKQGEHPRLLFRSRQQGNLLLNAQVGTNDNWKEFVDKIHPNELDMGLRFLVLHRSRLPDPLIVALVREQGGSDCRYNSALFGEVDGRLTELTPELPDHWFRGQVLLRMPLQGGSITLTVTSERYQNNDAHYTGPSHMEVDVFTYDASQGKFIETRRSEVNTDDLKVGGEDLVSLFGSFAQC
jgi:hypothetical protein